MLVCPTAKLRIAVCDDPANRQTSLSCKSSHKSKLWPYCTYSCLTPPIVVWMILYLRNFPTPSLYVLISYHGRQATARMPSFFRACVIRDLGVNTDASFSIDFWRETVTESTAESIPQEICLILLVEVSLSCSLVCDFVRTPVLKKDGIRGVACLP